MSILADKLVILPGILIGLSFHEFAHALMAYWMGDDTARLQGRMSVAPHTHIDPVGFLMLMFAGFGWARPVPIDERNFRNRNLGLFLVSIAGILMNLILAIVFFIILHFTSAAVGMDAYDRVMGAAVMINIGLACFNLIPLPPLDGSKILYSFLSPKWRYKMYEYEQYSRILLIVLLVTGGIGYLMHPIQRVIIGMMDAILGFVLR